MKYRKRFQIANFLKWKMLIGSVAKVISAFQKQLQIGLKIPEWQNSVDNVSCVLRNFYCHPLEFSR